MADSETQQAPKGSGENPDIGGIDQGPGNPGSEFESRSNGGPVTHDTGGRAHTGQDEGHPAGDGERSDRDVGGPRAAEDAPEQEGGAGQEGKGHGDISTKGMPPHE